MWNVLYKHRSRGSYRTPDLFGAFERFFFLNEGKIELLKIMIVVQYSASFLLILCKLHIFSALISYSLSSHVIITSLLVSYFFRNNYFLNFFISFYLALSVAFEEKIDIHLIIYCINYIGGHIPIKYFSYFCQFVCFTFSYVIIKTRNTSLIYYISIIVV